MTEENTTKYTGKNHLRPAHSSPYPTSRLAPQIELVDIAKQISHADSMIGHQTNAKLKLIADQIKSLQDEAKLILEQAQQDQELHHIECQFKKLPGRVYHVYEKTNGKRYFSMLSPAEWGGTPPHRYIGSYQMEADMSWKTVE